MPLEILGLDFGYSLKAAVEFYVLLKALDFSARYTSFSKTMEKINENPGGYYGCRIIAVGIVIGASNFV